MLSTKASAMLLFGVFLIVCGLGLAVWPQRQAQAVIKRIEQGDDRFFEEQRAYQAYPSLRDPRKIRLRGLIVALCGAIACATALLGG